VAALDFSIALATVFAGSVSIAELVFSTNGFGGSFVWIAELVGAELVVALSAAVPVAFLAAPAAVVFVLYISAAVPVAVVSVAASAASDLNVRVLHSSLRYFQQQYFSVCEIVFVVCCGFVLQAAVDAEADTASDVASLEFVRVSRLHHLLGSQDL